MSFRQFLAESGDMLDVSIQPAQKYLTSLKRKEEFLNSNVLITQKTDGVKLTVLKIANDGKLTDYVFSYKGNVLFKEEFGYNSRAKIKSESTGASQFRLAIEHFENNLDNEIPVNTELLIEFIMNKQTLVTKYNTYHKMILIGYSESSYNKESLKLGKLQTTNSGFLSELNEYYAKQLNINVPSVLFSGVMGNINSFEKGIVSKDLKANFQNFSKSMNWGFPELLIMDIRELLLSVKSKYGDIEEGVVLKTDEVILKFQQDNQHCKETREAMKREMRGTYQEEDIYWTNVRAQSLYMMTSSLSKLSLKDSLETLSSTLKSFTPEFKHPKKTVAQIKDDIQLTTKTQIVKNLRGNNGALIIGKFRVLTNAHVKMIKRASKVFDQVCICVVSSNETSGSKELREHMIKSVFPDISIIHHSSGNLISIIKKAPFNINAVYTGTDRVQEYTRQLSKSDGVYVREMERGADSLSATKVLTNIGDIAFFEKNTPKEIHSLYNLIKTSN